MIVFCFVYYVMLGESRRLGERDRVWFGLFWLRRSSLAMYFKQSTSRFLNGCQGSQCCLGSECSQGDWAMTRAQNDDLDELRNGRH